MFGTWKYDPETAEMRNLRRAYDPVAARSWQHQACNRCHEKKLKCSGSRAGCDRCAVSGHVCAYDRPGGSPKGGSGGSCGNRRGGHTRMASSSSSSSSSRKARATARNVSGLEARGRTSSSPALRAVAAAMQQSSTTAALPRGLRQTDSATGSPLQVGGGSGGPTQGQQQVAMGSFGGGGGCYGPCYHECAWISDFSGRVVMNPGLAMAPTPVLISGVGSAASLGGNHPLYDEGCGVAVGGNTANTDECIFWRQAR